MTKKIYRSMRGKEVDMESIRVRNEMAVAVGNTKTNARGDELGPGGKILKKREDVVSEYYDTNPKAVNVKPAVYIDEDTTSTSAILTEEMPVKKKL